MLKSGGDSNMLTKLSVAVVIHKTELDAVLALGMAFVALCTRNQQELVRFAIDNHGQ